jgi:hypothetical protein
VEAGLGVEAAIGANVSLSSTVSGRYGIGDADLTGYQGEARLKVSW